MQEVLQNYTCNIYTYRFIGFKEKYLFYITIYIAFFENKKITKSGQ